MKILLDVDGVLANFVKAAAKLHCRADPYDLPENFGKYSVEDIWGMSKKDFCEPMGYEYWKTVELLPYANDIANLLADTFGSDNICLLTAPLKTPGCLEGKREWIKKHFPGINWLIGKPKYFCAHTNSLLIDDSIVNCEKFVEAGGRAFLVPGPWNFKFEQDPLKALMRFIQNLKSTGIIF